MSTVFPLLSADDVLLDLKVAGRSGLFAEVAQRIEARYGLPHALIAEKLSARERLGSTGLGHGVAIPHARLPEAIRPFALFARTQFPIAFDAPDSKPVSDFLVLIVPNDSPELHLQLLSRLAGKFNDRDFRERLRAAADPATIATLLSLLKGGE